MEFAIGALALAAFFQLILIFKLKAEIKEVSQADCCDDVEDLKQAVKKIYDWIDAVGFQDFLDCVNTFLKAHDPPQDCGPGNDPDWPPKDPGDFPF